MLNSNIYTPENAIFSRAEGVDAFQSRRPNRVMESSTTATDVGGHRNAQRTTMNRMLIELFQKRVAETAVGASALRNQGGSHVVAKAREFLKLIDLPKFAVSDEARFRTLLDEETEALRRALPPTSRHWGTARKALNLFLRDVLYHSYLRTAYRFDRLERFLEVPLDSNVAEAVRAEAAGAGYLGSIPEWPGVKYLTPLESSTFQEAVRQVARRLGIAPVHLDVYCWRRLGRAQIHNPGLTPSQQGTNEHEVPR